MDNSTTSVITILISGITVTWAAVVALILYIRSLHLKAEKRSEAHGETMQACVTGHKNEIVEITKKFTEVVTNVNNSILGMDKQIELGNKLLEKTIEKNIKAFDDLHTAVLKGLIKPAR